MITIPIAIVDSAIRSYKTDINQFETDIKQNLTRISNDRRLSLQKLQYVRKMLRIVDELIIALPETLRRYQKEFDRIITPKEMASKSFASFRNRIIEGLGYTRKRTNFYPKFFYKIGIKACVYCNAHLTVAIEQENSLKKKPDYKAKFQVDHYWAKAKYPCFSVSVFNLYPVCGNCNNCKAKNEVDFSLYSTTIKVSNSPFKFVLNKGSMAKFLLSRNSSDLKLTFSEPGVAHPFRSFEETFDVQGIYNTQKDLAEELVLKAEIYSEQYKANLKKQFPKIFTSAAIFNRLMLGNYSSEQDIHKRPMAKFTIDIAKQIGLIKK